jgi:hypothetical protein
MSNCCVRGCVFIVRQVSGRRFDGLDFSPANRPRLFGKA